MKILSYDLGTGGIKTSLWNENGTPISSVFIPYNTYYPTHQWHEQKPIDWWNSVCLSTRKILKESHTQPTEIAALALSGHSMVVAPLDKQGNLLTENVPIWSDTRAEECIPDFFRELTYDDWYTTTGNGDPPACYSILKLMWMKKNQPDLFRQIHRVLGSKDYINYKLTGTICTDPSYASGFGVFNLSEWQFEDRFFEVAGIPKEIFPKIRPSDSIIGHLTPEAARETGLTPGIPVACGGVDNSCMALGARGIGEGRIYTSLGSSSWIAITSQKPIVDIKTRPFVFAHIQKGYYTSAVSIFSAGNSYRWVRDQLCRDIPSDEDAYLLMDRMVADTPIGSNGVIFNPSLAGGSTQEPSPYMRGGFAGITLSTTREEMIRASMEGITLALKEVLDILSANAKIDKDMLICGGGSKSKLWRQLFADIYNLDIIKTNIDQNAASLGAAAIAANACGLWNDYSRIESIHQIESVEKPIREQVEKYKVLQKVFHQYAKQTAELGETYKRYNF